MRFCDDGYLFSEEELKNLEKVEINGIVKYLLRYDRKNGQKLNDEEVKKQCREFSMKSVIARNLNVSMFLLNKCFNRLFKTTKLGEIKKQLKEEKPVKIEKIEKPVKIEKQEKPVKKRPPKNNFIRNPYKVVGLSIDEDIPGYGIKYKQKVLISK